MRPPFIEQNVVWLYSDDLDTHAAFYRDVLGLTQVLDQGVCRIFQVSPTGFLGVCNKEGRPRGTKGMMFTFLVEDVEEMYQYLLARGVAFDGPPNMLGGRTVYSAFFKDPIGYWLEIQEFNDPRWPYPEGRGPRRG
ncbi:VOC family protein [Falsiroseomonas sp. E2-1-a20]|uniref:VOC family protein n=1 Tax=Falsiroseomonas sp. E2-1-a20 TaxID=3239300 RepID=UPI003F3E0692